MECYLEVGNDLDIYKDVEILPENTYEIFKAKRADAASVVLEVIAIVTPITLPLIAGIIKERIRAKKYVKVKMDGIELQGLSEQSVERILREHSDKSESHD